MGAEESLARAEQGPARCLPPALQQHFSSTLRCPEEEIFRNISFCSVRNFSEICISLSALSFQPPAS